MDAETAAKPNRSLSPSQCRAARALLGWFQDKLAREASLSVQSVKAFESGKTNPLASTVDAIRDAFFRNGLVLLEPGDRHGLGTGVRWMRGDDRVEGTHNGN